MLRLFSPGYVPNVRAENSGAWRRPPEVPGATAGAGMWAPPPHAAGGHLEDIYQKLPQPGSAGQRREPGLAAVGAAGRVAMETPPAAHGLLAGGGHGKPAPEAPRRAAGALSPFYRPTGADLDPRNGQIVLSELGDREPQMSAPPDAPGSMPPQVSRQGWEESGEAAPPSTASAPRQAAPAVPGGGPSPRPGLPAASQAPRPAPLMPGAAPARSSAAPPAFGQSDGAASPGGGSASMQPVPRPLPVSAPLVTEGRSLSTRVGEPGAAAGAPQPQQPHLRPHPPGQPQSDAGLVHGTMRQWARDAALPPEQRREKTWQSLRDSRSKDDHTSWTDDLSNAQRNELVRRAAQELGLPEAKVRGMLETERLLDWSQHASPTSKAIKASWLYGAMNWAGLVPDVDLIRRLPDGSLIPNPEILGDRVLFDAALAATRFLPQEKERLRARWEQYHLAWLAQVRPALETMETLPGVENYMQWQERKREAGELGGKSDEEIADLYLTEQRQRPGWISLLDNISSNLLAGAHDLVGGLAGTIAFISGSKMMAEYSAGKSAEAQRTTGALQHTGNGGFVDDVIGGVARALPGLVGGVASGGTLSIAQGVGGAYTDVYAHHIANGMPHEQAAQAASRAAILSGVISAVVSKIPGMRATGGTGQITADAMRAELQTALRAVVSAAARKGVRMTQGAAEGMAEEFIEGALQHFNTGLHKGVPLEQLAREYLDQLPQSLATSGAMGGGHAGLGRNSQRPGGGQGIPPGSSIPDTATPGMQRQPGAPRLQFSQGGGKTGQPAPSGPLTPGQMMQVWAGQPGRFRRDPAKKDPTNDGPASTSKDLDQIFSDYDLYKEKVFVEETNVFRDHTTEKVYHIGVAKGGNAYLFLGKDGTVWLDLKEMRSADGGPAQGGDLVVQAAMTYAINNGLRWRPDPSGSSDIAVTRGYSHMLSSALRHQSTHHLAPNSTLDPATGELKVRIPGWMDGKSREAFEHNVNLLSTAEYNEVKAVMEKRGVKLDELDWDPKSDTVTHGPTGRRLSEGDIEDLISRLDPGSSGIGETTLSRALGAQAALQGKVFGGSDTQREGPALSDGGGETSGNPGVDVFRIRTSEKPLFYSQSGAGDSKSGSGPTLGSHFGGDAGRLNQQVAETTRFLYEKHPGLINDNTQVFHSADDLLNSDYAKQHPFTEEEKAAMRGAEGFFDASTGKTVIIAGNVGLRGGETPQSALTRVVLHERVGHDGLKLLLDAPDRSNGRPGINRARWDDIRHSISDDDLKAIGNEEGYQHLQGNPEALALEWFARKAESSPELLKQNSVLSQMWQKFTEMVQDVRAHLGMDPLKGADLDTQVMALLSRARQAAVKGGGANAGAGANSGGGVKGGGAAGANSAAPAFPNTAATLAPAAGGPGASAAPPSGTASLARAPLDVEGSKRLIANVRANAARRPLHPVEQADLDQAERIVAQAPVPAPQPQPPATRARPPLDVAGSRRLIANVRAMPERQRQHPTVQADLAQALRVVAQAEGASNSSSAASGQTPPRAPTGGLHTRQYSMASYAALRRREDRPQSWQEVKPGHRWMSAKQHLPRTGDKVPVFPILKRGTFQEQVNAVANWLTVADPVSDPWGMKIIFNHPQDKGTQPTAMHNRAAHLIGENLDKSVENRSQDKRKIAWFGAVRKTIQDAQSRAVAQTGEVLYFRNYVDGIHMVVVDDGEVKDQGAIITQYAPESFEGRYKDLRVEFTRDSHRPAPSSPR